MRRIGNISSEPTIGRYEAFTANGVRGADCLLPGAELAPGMMPEQARVDVYVNVK
jgi:hypothetical protein